MTPSQVETVARALCAGAEVVEAARAGGVPVAAVEEELRPLSPDEFLSRAERPLAKRLRELEAEARARRRREALGRLEALLDHPDPRVRVLAAKALLRHTQ